MPTLKVVLTDHQVELIERLIESRRYRSTSEVLHEGLRLVEQRIAEDRARLKKIRAAIQIGFDDLDAGRVSRPLSGAALRKHLRGLMRNAVPARRRRSK